jgi:hypothetical protein
MPSNAWRTKSRKGGLVVVRPWRRARPRTRRAVIRVIVRRAGRGAGARSRRLVWMLRRFSPRRGLLLGWPRGNGRRCDRCLARRGRRRWRRAWLRAGARLRDVPDGADRGGGVTRPDRGVGAAGRGGGGQREKDCGRSCQRDRSDAQWSEPANGFRQVTGGRSGWGDPVEGDFQSPFQSGIHAMVLSARHSNSLPVLKTTRP